MEAISQNSKITQTWRVKDIYKAVTNNLLLDLEQGVIPWQKSADPTGHDIMLMPTNPVTNNYYQKINVILLWTSANRNNFTSNDWAGLKQWNSVKENVRRNEKGTLITYFDAMYKEVNGQVLKTLFLNYTYVFNRCQLSSFDPNTKQAPELPPTLNRIATIDQFVNNVGAIVHQHKGAAHYIPASDKILLPYSDVWSSTGLPRRQTEFYPALFSKLVQWTGAKHRLNRFVGLQSGDHAHVTEELVAEFGGDFLCSTFKINKMQSSACESIDRWVNILKENKQCVFEAANQASNAVNFLNQASKEKLSPDHKTSFIFT